MPKRRFLVIAPNLIPHYQNLVTKHFRDGGFGFWHWGTDTWLLTTYSLETDAVSIRDVVLGFVPKINVIVLEVSSVFWAANGPQQWLEWLRTSWEDE